MKFKIETLGCKMNFVDSERIGNTLIEWGWQYDEENPDYIIINTCTVTNTADKKSQTKAKQSQKQATLIITGCSTRTSAEKWKLKFSEAIICPEAKDVLAYCRQLENQYEPLPEISQSPQDRTRKFIEIQTGCDTYCSYCIIPFARGKSKSRPPDEIIAEIQQAEREGYQEIVITGINLAAWGARHTRKPEDNKFANLLQGILNQTHIPRIRISSIGPEYITHPFFDIYADERMCDHLHISVQSGCDEILQKMNRGHGTQEIKNIIQKAKQKRPHTAFTCDIIVGFPGETNKHFEETCAFIKALGFMHVHVFPFSVRSGTLAEKMPNQIPEKIKKERATKLRSISKKLKQKFYENNEGISKKVLWEKKNQGLTTNFIRVYKKNAPENTIETKIITKQDIISAR